MKKELHANISFQLNMPVAELTNARSSKQKKNTKAVNQIETTASPRDAQVVTRSNQ